MALEEDETIKITHGGIEMRRMAETRRKGKGEECSGMLRNALKNATKNAPKFDFHSAMC